MSSEKRVDRIIVFLIFFGVFLILGLIGFYISDKLVNEKQSYNNDIDTTLTRDDVLVYLDYIPTLTERFEYTDAYSNKKVTLSDIDEYVYLTHVFEKSEFVENISDFYGTVCGASGYCSAFKNVLISEFKNNLNSFYKLDKINNINNFGCNIVKGNTYYGGDFCDRGRYYWSKVNKIVDYKIENDKLIIYEKAAFYSNSYNDGCEGCYDIFKDSNHNNLDIYEVYKEQDIEKYLNNNIDKFTTFKHTFYKDKNNYYWYSTEPM